MDDYQLRHLFAVVDGGINLLRANVNRLTDAQRQKLGANFVEVEPPSTVAPQLTPASEASPKAAKPKVGGAPKAEEAPRDI